MVHNGVIENEEELRKIIQPEGLVSETDTELIACLVSRFYRQGKPDFFQSALKAMDLLKGSYAAAVLCAEAPGELIAFKKGPPLALCRGHGEFFVSSDPHVAGKYSEELLFLEDGDILHLQKNQFKVFHTGDGAPPRLVAAGAPRERSLKQQGADSGQQTARGRQQADQGAAPQRKFIRWPVKESLSEKGGYPHFMLKEIFEQPLAASRLIGANIDKARGELRLQISKGDKKSFDSLWKNHSRILIIACGSSYHAALFAKYIMEEMAPIHVDVEVASEFIYRIAALRHKGPALFISQSGETADILKALEQTKKQGLSAISLCNVQGSSLDRRADFGLNMAAGHETAVASTKTFSASLIMLSMLSLHIARLKSRLSENPHQGEAAPPAGSRGKTARPKPPAGLKAKPFKSAARKPQSGGEGREIIKSLLSLPSLMEEALSYDRLFLDQVERLKRFSGFFFLGRGAYYPIALEGALKLKEISYLHAEGYPAGEMKHGPLAMIDENMMAVFLLPSSEALYEKALTNLKEAKARGAALMAIGGPAESSELKKLCGSHLPLPKTHKALHPVLSLIPLQLMAYFISRSCGYNADRPRNLAKSVTVE